MRTASPSLGCNILFQWRVGENFLSHGRFPIKHSLFIGMLYLMDPRAAFLYLDTIDILGSFSLVGSGLCLVGCLAASLVSAH